MSFSRCLNLSSVAVLIMATPFLMVLSRNITSPVFAAAALLLSVIVWKDQGRHVLFRSLRRVATSTAGIVFAVTVLYMAASTGWTTSFARGVEATAHMAGNLLLFALSLAALSVVQQPLRLKSWVFCVALVATAALILSELHFGTPVRAFFGAAAEAFRMNRAAVALVLFLPLAFALLPRTLAFMALRAVAFVVICLAAFSSESESAKLALMAAAVSYPLFFMLKSRSIWVLGALVLASLILMPLAAPYVMSLIPDALESRLAYGSVGLRADIWAAHASLLINAPVFGHGMDASFMAAKDYSDSGIPDLFLRWGHPHNFSIQVWYELGVTGIVLFAVLIALFFRSLKVVPAAFLPALLSTVVAVWTVSLVSHGAWQAWWWCLGGLLCLMWLIALKGRDGTPVSQTAGKAVV